MVNSPTRSAASLRHYHILPEAENPHSLNHEFCFWFQPRFWLGSLTTVPEAFRRWFWTTFLTISMVHPFISLPFCIHYASGLPICSYVAMLFVYYRAFLIIAIKSLLFDKDNRLNNWRCWLPAVANYSLCSNAMAASLQCVIRAIRQLLCR